MPKILRTGGDLTRFWHPKKHKISVLNVFIDKYMWNLGSVKVSETCNASNLEQSDAQKFYEYCELRLL